MREVIVGGGYDVQNIKALTAASNLISLTVFSCDICSLFSAGKSDFNN